MGRSTQRPDSPQPANPEGNHSRIPEPGIHRAATGMSDAVSTTSDPDNVERPVREQLRNAHLEESARSPRSSLAEDRDMPDTGSRRSSSVDRIMTDLERERWVKAKPSQNARPRRSASEEPTVADVQTINNALQPTRNDVSKPSQGNDTVSEGGSSGTFSPAEDAQRGRVRRKRSYEEVEGAQQDDERHERHHHRKRSRDMKHGHLHSHSRPTSRTTSGEHIAEEADEGDHMMEDKIADVSKPTAGGAAQAATPPVPSETAQKSRKDGAASPKNKRSRDEFLQDNHGSPAETSAKTSTEKGAAVAPKTEQESAQRPPNDTATDEPAAKRIPPTSGFLNTSSVSPFGALAREQSPSKSPPPQTFAKSGFGALANSSTSPFGALGTENRSASPFGSLGSSTPLSGSGFGSPVKSSTPSTSVFGGALGAKPAFASSSTSPFATAASGFGAIRGGLGGFGNAPTARLASFSSGGGIGISGLSSKPVKPFGVKRDDGEEADGSGGEEDEEKAQPASQTKEEERMQDPRFVRQDVETGEEDERTEFQCRAKLYTFVTDDGKKEWKERGLGQLKVNIHKPDPTDDDPRPKKKARFIMRSEGTQRMVLNSPIKKELKFGDDHPPKGPSILFMGTMDGQKLELMQLKTKPANAVELWETVKELQSEL